MNIATGARGARNVIVTSLCWATTCATSMAQPSEAQVNAIRQACRGDYMAHCAGVPTGGAESLACLQRNAAQTSPACRSALQAVAAAEPGAAVPERKTTAAASRSSGVTPVSTQWPHVVAMGSGSATVYQPQIVAWPDHRTLNTRIAVAITPAGAKTPVLGTIEMSFASASDLATRTVLLTDAKLTSTRFPSLDTSQAAQIEEQIRSAVANLGPKEIPLDTVTLSLRGQSEKPADSPVKNDPPVIFVSSKPASLVVFDGEPVLAPLAGTTLSFAVNTNWDVFFDESNKTWYMLNNGGWLSAAAVKGPWAPAGKLPPAFQKIPDDANFAQVKKQIPGRPIAARDVPTIFVSSVPAEIIVTSGPAQYRPIAGTSLSYVANTDPALFRMGSGGSFYYLVSGRWFSAPELQGPWTFATPNLPPDFARIPADGPRGFVLASVPGTPQAQEALIQSQIPQQATLNRDAAKVEVVYAGAPKFEPIAGTTLLYAANTSFDVLKVGDVYYTCWQAAWFTAPSPNGPWVLAATVPQVIYTIPPSSPLYRVTYVTVYGSTTTTVTYGYTAGYTMAYVSAGVVVYGTGWYYPPYIYPAPIPIYYPYPFSFSGATYYNPATGAWAHGGAIYGPYGGVAKGGTAYNPNTGAWASGGAIYGPNGGVGGFSAYNPSTGSYAHGSAVWGPDGASGNASWYNARTGRSGSTNQNSNEYGRWGSSTISGPNQTVHTQSQGNSRGNVGSFTSTSGARGAGVSGANGNRAGIVQGKGGDVYAGADGNVYKKTDSGWEKYDQGSWNQVQKPTNSRDNQNLSGATQRTNASTGQNLSGATERTNAGTSQNLSGETQRANAGAGQANRAGSATATPMASDGARGLSSGQGGRLGQFGGEGREGFGQLEQDREARTQGAQRQHEFQSGGGFAGRGGFEGRGGGRAARR